MVTFTLLLFPVRKQVVLVLIQNTLNFAQFVCSKTTGARHSHWIAVHLPAAGALRLSQETAYPLDGKVTLRIGLGDEAVFALRLRIPTWSRQTAVRVNGEPAGDMQPGAYLSLGRAWRDGDVVELALDMGLHFWFGERESAGKSSIYRGPLLLAYDQRYNQVDPHEIPALDLQQLACEPATWQGPLPPWLLLRCRAQDGQALTLCDFANAGMAGTEYRSWLPVAASFPRPPSRSLPVWAAVLLGD